VEGTAIVDRINAGAGLVLWPKTVAERLDDVVSCDSDVSRSVVEHLRNGAKHSVTAPYGGSVFLKRRIP